MKAMTVRALLTSLALAAIAELGLVSPVSAQSNELLLEKANLVYQGAFRVPHINCVSPTYACFSYGGRAITYNPANNSLFIIGHPYGQLSAEIAVPPIINSTNLNALNTATVLQPFADPTDGKRNLVNPSTVNANDIGGQLIFNDRLIISVYSYYDGAATQSSSHFARPLDLSINDQISGPYRVGSQYPGFVSGYMTLVPAEWQSLFGGPALTGNCCLAITSIQSNGPAASVFDPSALGVRIPTAATPVVGYPHEDPLGPGYGTQNGIFNGTTQVTGIVFPPGTRSVLLFGHQGTGPFCYGAGTSTQALGGTPTGQGDIWCYDPANSSKGTHAYPYVYEIWAYDANDLLAVKNGSKLSYEIKPYAFWTFSLPFESPNNYNGIGGAAYDSQHQLIFVSQLSGDDGANPVIHVFKVDTSLQVPQPPTALQAQ